MSKELPQNNNNEEVDLLILFNYIGERLNRFFGLFKKIILFFYSTFIFSAKAVIKNIKLIVIVMVLAGVLGYVLERSRPVVYDSNMLVRTNFDTKYQLASNINYYNALISDKNYQALSEIFEISEDDLQHVERFAMAIGPETENERIVEYDRFLKSIDSIRAQDITYDEYLENRDIYSGNLFEITVESRKKDIFRSLETGINESFESKYSLEEKEKRERKLDIRKQSLEAQLNTIDSLQSVYIQVIQNESETTKTNLDLGEGLLLKQDKSQTKEFPLLEKRVKIVDLLRALEEERLEEDELFKVVSQLQLTGNLVSHWYNKYSLLFPLIAFGLLSIGYVARKFAVYVSNYEG